MSKIKDYIIYDDFRSQTSEQAENTTQQAFYLNYIGPTKETLQRHPESFPFYQVYPAGKQTGVAEIVFVYQVYPEGKRTGVAEIFSVSTKCFQKKSVWDGINCLSVYQVYSVENVQGWQKSFLCLQMYSSGSLQEWQKLSVFLPSVLSMKAHRSGRYCFSLSIKSIE